MFIENDYKLEYDKIIENAILNPPVGVSESHHIIPKSFFENVSDSNYPENLVRLSVVDHLKVHLLLPYFTEGDYKDKMTRAIFAMYNRGQKEFANFDEYEKVKENFQEMQSRRMLDPNNPHPMRGKLGKDSPIFGIKRSDETKQRMKDSKTKEISKEQKEAYSEAGKKGGKAAWKNREIKTCPHCGKEGEVANMTRWHFENCKQKMEN